MHSPNIFHYKRLVLPLAMITVACNCTTPAKQLDTQSAVSGNDLTMVAGCSQTQLGVGYLVCRQEEGEDAGSSYLYIHTPPNLNCDDENGCVYFKIFFPDGRPAYEGKVEKSQSFSRVEWSKIIGKPVFELDDKGFYAVSVTVKFRDEHGVPHSTYLDGFVFVRVLKKEYISLLQNEEDPNWYFIWKHNDRTIKMTSGGRVFVSPLKPLLFGLE